MVSVLQDLGGSLKLRVELKEERAVLKGRFLLPHPQYLYVNYINYH